MKYLMILALTLSLSPAFAREGNDGPNAVPMPPPTVLAERTMACGFFCPNGDYRGVRIMSNGNVISFSGERNSAEKTENIAVLTAPVLQELVKGVDSIHPAELIDQQAGQPQCMDAPGTTYLVFQRSEKVRIAGHYGCHTFALPNNEGNEIVRLLDQFNDN